MLVNIPTYFITVKRVPRVLVGYLTSDSTRGSKLLPKCYQFFLDPRHLLSLMKEIKKVKKLHTYIALPEVHGRLICGLLYITSPAGLLHQTLVWRFQEATYIPMQGEALTCLPSNVMALLVLIYTWVGWSLVNLKQGSPQPRLPQFCLWSVSNPTSHTRAKNYTIAPPEIKPTDQSV